MLNGNGDAPGKLALVAFHEQPTAANCESEFHISELITEHEVGRILCDRKH